MKEDALRGAALVGRDDVPEAGEIADDGLEPPERTGAGVRLVAALDAGPLVAGHGPRSGVRQEVDEHAIAQVREATLRAYEAQTSACYSTSELWDDGILDPVDTRNALGIAISASLNSPLGRPGNGVFRF